MKRATLFFVVMVFMATPLLAQSVGVFHGLKFRQHRFPDCSDQSGFSTTLKICTLGDSVIKWQVAEADGCNVGRLLAFQLGNQTDDRSLGGAKFHNAAANCLYTLIRAVGWCSDADNHLLSQFGVATCEGNSNCDWIVFNGGGWDLEVVGSGCACANEAACIPCDDSGCIAAVDSLAENTGETGYVYDFIDAAKTNSSGVKFVFVGYYMNESGTGWADYNGCKSLYNDRLEYIANNDSAVWFVNNEDASDHEYHDEFFHTDGAHPLKRYRLEISDRIAAIIAAEEGL